MELLRLLEKRGAATRPHVHGPLLDHLFGTEALLRRWRAKDTVVLAGLAHAAYGTDGFDDHLLQLDEHQLLRAAGGEDIEALVYLYASCDRKVVYPQLAGRERVNFRDRFTGQSFEASQQLVRDFTDLTIANETELFVVAPSVSNSNGLGQLLEDVRFRASPGVLAGAGTLFRQHRICS